MSQSLYPTWYEFKKDIQKELGRTILNQEWLRLKPTKPLPWDESCKKSVLAELRKSNHRTQTQCPYASTRT